MTEMENEFHFVDDNDFGDLLPRPANEAIDYIYQELSESELMSEMGF